MIDINSLGQRQAYMLYRIFAQQLESLEKKDNLSGAEQATLASARQQMQFIEQWASQKMEAKMNWTKEELLLNYGATPTLTLTFHPGTASNKKYGDEVTVNIKFPEDEILVMLQNIQDKKERKSSEVSFEIVDGKQSGSFPTKELFEVAGRHL